MDPGPGGAKTYGTATLMNSVQDLSSVGVKGGDGGRPSPHGEPLPHLSAGVPLLRQHTYTSP